MSSDEELSAEPRQLQPYMYEPLAADSAASGHYDSVRSRWQRVTSHMPKNSYRPTKKTNKLVIFSILRHNLSKFVTQTGLYCIKQLETTFNQVGKKSLHIILKSGVGLTVTASADDEDLSPELKLEREKLRRQQNNARER